MLVSCCHTCLKRGWCDFFIFSCFFLLSLFSSPTQCLDLDKFEAMSDEGALVDRALELLNEEKYWAGVVVEGLDANATQLPAFVKYKIRMDIEDVERSNKIKDR